MIKQIVQFKPLSLTKHYYPATLTLVTNFTEIGKSKP